MTSLDMQEKELLIEKFAENVVLYKALKSRLNVHIFMTCAAFAIFMIVLLFLNISGKMMLYMYAVPGFLLIFFQGFSRHTKELNKLIKKCSNNKLKHSQFKKLIKADEFVGSMVAEILNSAR